MASASNVAITNNQDPWLANSGTLDHITANLNNLSIQSQYKGPEQVIVGNGQSLPINHIGNTALHTKYHNFVLKNVLHVPRIAMNLLSVHKFCLHNNCSCYFDANIIKIQDIPTGRLLYKGLSENSVYPIYSKNFIKPSSHFKSVSSPCQTHPSTTPNLPLVHSSFHVNKPNKWLLWHHRLGHPSDKVLNISLSFIDRVCISSTNKTLSHCKHCLSGKMHQFSFPISNFHASKPLELVHSDVWDPAPVKSSNDFQYYVLFVDAYSKFTWLYLLKHKSDVLEVFKFFKAFVENQLNSKIKILKSDNGGEYTSNAFKHFCASHGITHQFSCPHTPQQNGVAERKHRHIVECALTLLSHSQLSPIFWSYAVSTEVHLINRLPTPTLHNSTPWEVLFKSKLDLTYLRTFGCICFPLLKSYNAHKLLPHTSLCIFLGYPAHSKGYICQDPVTSQVYISRHVRFNEHEFISSLALSTGTSQDSGIHSTSTPFPTPFIPTQSTPISYDTQHPFSPPLPSATSPFAQSYATAPSAQPTDTQPTVTQIPDTSPTSTQPYTHASSSSIVSPHPTSTSNSSSPSPISPHISPTTLSTIPTQVPITGNTHPMTDLVQCAPPKKVPSPLKPDYTLTEPPSYKIAIQHPQWCSTMAAEFNAL